jgi:starch synthase (maltosyl-transferring)
LNYTNNVLSLNFSDTTGVLEQLCLQDGENVLNQGAGGSALDLMIGGEGWLSATKSASFVGGSGIEGGLILEVKMGPVTVLDSYRIEGSLISRQVRIENRGQQEIQVRRLRMMLLGARIGEAADCRFEVPASILRPRIPLDKMIQLKAHWSDDESILPGAIGWQDFLGSAPDMTPGLIVIHNPVREMSLMVWYYSEVESATPKILGVDHALNLGHELGLAGWLAPGASLTGGTQYIQLVEGSWNEALEAYRMTYARVGVEPPLYGHPPEWVSTAAIYEVHPGQYGGFRGLSAELPRIRSIGFDVLYLMPVMRFNNRSGAAWDENWSGSGSPYAILDFEAFEPTLGSEEEFIHLVGAAHDNGMKVLMDFVAQGTALDARYITEHPEWYCRDESGELVSSHGWLDTYSLDWANPEYQA